MRYWILSCMFLLTVCLCFAVNPDVTQTVMKAVNLPEGLTTVRNQDRPTPVWSFDTIPTNLVTSYYDYMIGGYSHLPVRKVPDAAWGGYFATFHARRTANGTRRAFYSYFDSNVVMNCNEITVFNNNEGYPGMDVDPNSGKPIYAWHANADGNIDTDYEVQMASDAFITGIAGLMSDPVIAINNPVPITAFPPQAPNGVTTNDNEFIWPQVEIGPSPIANKRRAYILTRNATSHSYGPSENPYIAYTDFNGEDIEMGNTLTWNYLQLPEMNNWNNDTTWRRPFMSMVTDNAGNLYYAGYHLAYQSDGTTPINEPDIDIFVCSNYGQGTWQHHTFSSKIPSWNPPTQNGIGPGLFLRSNGQPFADNEIYWKLNNSGHFNVVIDNNGKLHMIGLWQFANVENSYYQELNTIREFTWNLNAPQGFIQEIYPIAAASNDTFIWQPWDADGDHVVDVYDPTGNPLVTTDWNFPHWDSTVHDNAMMFHYNNQRITESNSSGWMAAVWQNSWRARQYNAGGNAAYQAYANTPEVFISITHNYGANWSEPIKLNNVEIPQLNNVVPMWVYPADVIASAGNEGRLPLMYYNDASWGAYAVTPSVGTDAGGQVSMMILDIIFSNVIPTGINGVVVSGATSQPVPFATVTSGNYSTVANAQGQYLLNLPAGTHSVTAAGLGFLPTTIDNIEVVNEQMTVVNFALVNSPTVLVFGLVQGSIPPHPISGAVVSLTGPLNYSVTTDATGNFVIPNVVTNLTYVYHIVAQGYDTLTGTLQVVMSDVNMGILTLSEIHNAPASAMATLAADNNSATVTWTPPSVASLERANAMLERDLTGYRIWRLVSGNESNQQLWTVVGNTSAGVLSLQDSSWAQLSAGIYLYAVKAQYSDAQYSDPVFSNNLTRYTGGTFYGFVRDAGDFGILDAAVTLTRVVPDGHGPYTTTTLANGLFSFSNVWYGDYMLSCSATHYQPVEPVAVTVEANAALSYNFVLMDSLQAAVNVNAAVNESNTSVTVTWQSPQGNNERYIIGYKIWRLLESQSQNQAVWNQLTPQPLAFTSYVDNGWAQAASGMYLYAVQVIYSGDYGSEFAFSNPVEKTVGVIDPSGVPAVTGLIRCYPNPFTTTVSIDYGVKDPQQISIDIYNIAGQHVKTLYAGQRAASNAKVVWNCKDSQGRAVRPGIYLCKMKAGSKDSVLKLMLLK